MGRVLFIYAEEPLHPGAERGVADVDLPVQREATTGFLVIGASSVRRVLREPLQDLAWKEHERILFGSILRRIEGDRFGAGILRVRDARILLLPVRAHPEVFVWVTSPLCVARLRRLLNGALPTFAPIADDRALVGTMPSLTSGLVLEEYTVTADKQQEAAVNQLADWLSQNALPSIRKYEFWQRWLCEKNGSTIRNARLVVVSDSFFGELCRTACEVSTHVRISAETGTVEEGALWTEEDVPQESLFFTAVECDVPPKECPDDFKDKDNGQPSAQKALDFLRSKLPDSTPLVIGGEEGTGRGCVRVRWAPDSVDDPR